MTGSDSNLVRTCNPQVNQICNRALLSCGKKFHDTCKKINKASNKIGSKINVFLASVLAAYGTESREGITIMAYLCPRYY